MCRRCTANFKHFTSARTFDEHGELAGGVSIPPQIFRVGFLEMDPPESTKLRRLLNPWFTAKAVDAGRGRIQESASWAIDSVIERGACDVMVDLASPFPSLLFLDLLGIPVNRWKAYKEITDRVTAQSPDARIGLDWMRADVEAEVRRQREDGGAGLIADLVRAEVDGDPISHELATELVYMLLLGGTGTTITTIANTLRHLDLHPDDRARIMEDRTLLPAAIEEIIRFYAPAMGLARNATEGAEIAGVHVPRRRASDRFDRVGEPGRIGVRRRRASGLRPLPQPAPQLRHRTAQVHRRRLRPGQHRAVHQRGARSPPRLPDRPRCRGPLSVDAAGHGLHHDADDVHAGCPGAVRHRR